jgi:glycosyl transferase family 25
MQRDVARWQSMQSQFAAYGLTCERVEAADGGTLTADQRKSVYSDFWFRLFHGRSAGNNEIGCALSHRKIYAMMVERKQDWAIIFEDDALLLPELTQQLTEIESETRDFDMVQLYAFREPQKLHHKAASGAFTVMTYAGPHGSSAAYGLRLSGANKILRHAKIRFAVDKWLWAAAISGLSCCAVHPYFVALHEELSQISTIDASVAGGRGTSMVWRVVVLPVLRMARTVILMVRGI